MAREPSQPSYTCPEINSVIKDIKSVIQSLKSVDWNIDTENPSSVEYQMEKVNEARCELESFEDNLEKLRSDNDSLREYGNYWEKRARQLEDEVEELSNQLQNTY